MLLAWYAIVRHDLMAAPEGGGHGSAASGRLLDDVRSGARVGGPAFQISVPDRPRDRGRGARLRAAAAAARVRPAVPARARIAADSLPGGPAHVLARVQGEHPPAPAAAPPPRSPPPTMPGPPVLCVGGSRPPPDVAAATSILSRLNIPRN